MSHLRAPDLAPEFDPDWVAFTGLERMTNHWNRAAWWPGRQAYYWYLTFSSNVDLRSLSEHCQSALKAPHFDFVPIGDLHMTIDRIGFDDAIRPDELNAVAVAATHECQRLAPFDMLIGPLAGSAGAISFSAAPLEPILEVREALQAATAKVRKRSEFAKDNFRPHVGIAYCNTEVPTSSVVPKVRPLRELPPARAHVGGASLVLLTRGVQSYRWSTLTDVRFSETKNLV